MKRFQNRGDVWVFRRVSDSASKEVLDVLKSIYLGFRKAILTADLRLRFVASNQAQLSLKSARQFRRVWTTVDTSRSCCYRRTLPPTKTSVRRRVVGRLHWSLRRGSCAIISPGNSYSRWRLQPAVDGRSPRPHGSHAHVHQIRSSVYGRFVYLVRRGGGSHVLASLVSSDYKAIIAHFETARRAPVKTTTQRTFRKRSPTQHALFLQRVTTEAVDRGYMGNKIILK